MTISSFQITALLVTFGLAIPVVALYEGARTRRLDQDDRSPLEQWQNPPPFKEYLPEVACALAYLALIATGFYFYMGDLFLALFLVYFFALPIIFTSAGLDKES